MQFRILGPLEVLHDGDRLQLGGVRRRAVLARLLLCPGRAVSADRLIDDVWADQPPATARKNLQKYVSELRGLLPTPVLTTTAGGYLLDVPPGVVDAQRFERLVERSEFAEALELWRGDVLADLPAYGFVAVERARLEELRMLAWQARVAADLDAGRHEQVVGELAEALEAHPHRERLVELYMLALYRSGRQGDALTAFQAHRARLAEDLGVEPGPGLRDLQVSILRQEVGLRSGRPTEPQAPRGNLPRVLTSFVGRDDELAAVDERLRGNRLVTLTGPGGVGKTRLAVEAAGHVDGAWLVDLAEVRVDEQVPAAVATALRTDIRHAPDAVTGIEARLLGSGPTLVVLDNCEHVVGACSALLRRLLGTCPDLTVLATSRRPLGVEGEYVLPVASLGEEDAVRLFVERGLFTGQLVDGGWSADEVAALCRRLDWLPLAIELAASQLRVLSLAELSARMDRRLAFHGSADQRSPRQGTLRDTVAWSCDLISADTQQVFARCGVFLGSVSLDGAEAVCADLGLTPDEVLDHVTTLVDHSLLLRVSGVGAADSRYRLLETLRLFALDLLAGSDAVEIACRAHAAHVRSVAARAGRGINGPEELVWQRRMEVEAPNVEAALGWAAEHDWSMAVGLAVALWPYWDAGWGERSGIAYVERLLAVDPPPDPEQRAWALVVAADLAANQGDARKAVPWAREAVQYFSDGGRPGRGQALVALGGALGSEGGLHEAGEVLDEALRAADRLGDDVLAARTLNRRHFVAARQGDHVTAEVFGRQELARWSKIGSARGHATALRHLAVTAFRFGDLDHADALCEQALTIWRDAEDPAAVAHVQTTLGDIARERGDVSRATALYRAALVDLQAIGDRRCEASTCKNLATILAVEDSHEQSAHLFREGISLRHELGDQVGLAECFEGLAASLRALSRDEECAILLGAAAALRTTHESLPTDAEQRAVDDLASAARRELGSGRFAVSWERGLQMGLDQVVDFALQHQA